MHRNKKRFGVIKHNTIYSNRYPIHIASQWFIPKSAYFQLCIYFPCRDLPDFLLVLYIHWITLVEIQKRLSCSCERMTKLISLRQLGIYRSLRGCTEIRYTQFVASALIVSFLRKGVWNSQHDWIMDNVEKYIDRETQYEFLWIDTSIYVASGKDLFIWEVYGIKIRAKRKSRRLECTFT